MLRSLQASTAVVMMVGISAASMAPTFLAVAPAQAQTTFTDVTSNYWANGFIQELSNRGVIKGFTDGTFRPNDIVTRAQFASMISGFDTANVRSAVAFPDVPSSFWANNAIRTAYQKGFMSGFPNGTFSPNQQIPRAQALVSLANGLGYTTNGNVDSVLNFYSDSTSIPDYARTSIAAATTKSMVVNFPTVTQLNPNRSMTRAEAAALIYQALQSQNKVPAIASAYIVSGGPAVATDLTIPAGTKLPVKYDKAAKILLGKNEPVPSALSLTIPQNIVDANGAVLIASGSTVEGKLVVDKGAAQFVAERLIMTNGKSFNLSAVSDKITTTETVTKGASAGGVIKGTVLGAAAAAGIAAVTGDRNVNAWETLAGAGAGALAGLIFSKDKVDLIVVQPNTDLAIKLTSELTLPKPSN
jgi:S-layer homology domain